MDISRVLGTDEAPGCAQDDLATGQGKRSKPGLSLRGATA